MRKQVNMRAVQQSYRERKKKKAAENKEMLEAAAVLSIFLLFAFLFFHQYLVW
ncbi:hypothetical protein [Metabacillus indicus]|uniref:hypothetical protein n=1 Tax=Metabacillus indicus TaxID=246786 RepID=UPI003CF003E0